MRDYYGSGNSECIEAITLATKGFFGTDAFAIGNFVKYVYRAGKKTESPNEDMHKALDYMGLFLFGKFGEGHRVSKSRIDWKYACMCVWTFRDKGDNEIIELPNHLADWRNRVQGR